MHRFHLRALSLLAIATGFMGVATMAQAAPAPAKAAPVKTVTHTVTGKQTVITLSSTLAGLIKAKILKLSAVGGAKIVGGKVVVPVTGGSIVTPALTAKLTHDGGFKITGPKHSITVTALVVSHKAKTTVVRATVAGKTITLATVSKFKSAKKGTTLTGELDITAAAAKAINTVFGKGGLVTKGVVLGTFKSTVTYK